MLNRDHFMTQNSANVNDGTHRQVTLTNQTGPGFAGGNAALYCQAFSGISFPKWENSAGTIFLFNVNPVMAVNGYSGMPGGSTRGVIVQWGRVSVAAGSGQFTGTVTFATNNIAFPSNCFVVLAQILYTGSPTSSGSQVVYIAQDTLSNTKFDWAVNKTSSSIYGFNWIAIGN